MNEEYDSEEFEEEQAVISHPEFRVTALFGEVNSKNAKDLLASFLVFKEPDIEPDTGVEVYQPFDFYISTAGGHASDMFAIYDLMRVVRETTEIRTFGFGKVMSAGVLLLAAGTKGYRKIGKNCRVMIHSANSSYYGSVNSAGAQIQEVQQLQNMLVDALLKETTMDKQKLDEIMNSGINRYLSAEEALKLGIADIIV